MKEVDTLSHSENKIDYGIMLAKYGTILTIVFVFVFFSLTTARFLQFENLINVVRQISTLAIVSFGITIAMAAGDFDMSVGSIVGLCGVIVTGLLVNGHSIFVSILLTLIVGGLLGGINGTISTRVGIPSILLLLLLP